MAVTPGDQKDSGDGGRLVNTKLKEPKIAGKLADASDLHGSCLEMVEQDRRRYSDQEGSDDRDRLVCMKLKVAEIAEKLTGASNMNKQSLTMANVVGKELEGSEHCQSFHWQ